MSVVPKAGEPLWIADTRELYIGDGVTRGGIKVTSSGGGGGSGTGAVSSVAGRTGDVTLNRADVGLDRVDNTPDSQKPISSATQTALDKKQPTGSYATTSQLTTGLSSKANTNHGHVIADVGGLSSMLDSKQPAGDYATNTALAGKADSSHTHNVADIEATNIANNRFLRGDGTWQIPANTTYSAITQAEAENPGSTTARLATGQRIAQGAIAATSSALASKASINSPALTGVPTAPTPARAVNTDQIATAKMVQDVIIAYNTAIGEQVPWARWV